MDLMSTSKAAVSGLHLFVVTFQLKEICNFPQVQQVQDLKESKNLSITQIAKITGKGRNTIYKVLKEELNYVPYNRLVKATKGETNETK